jgi:hypothetical protein
LPTYEQVLTSLLRLNKPVLEGTISREDANFVRTNLDTYLKHLKLKGSSPGAAARGLDIEKLRRLASQNPEIAHILEHVMSDEDLWAYLGLPDQLDEDAGAGQDSESAEQDEDGADGDQKVT